MMKQVWGALVWGLGLVLPGLAQAWGMEGHQVIAALAEAQLSAPARQEVQRLLALEPGATLESVASWADEHRSPETAPWHYVNFPRNDCHYDAQRDCPGGHCVVAAIAHESDLLRSAGTDLQRLAALKYLVHLVGDVHQPLHAGFLDDRGGNTYRLRTFMAESNLHAVWDSGLINYLDQDAAQLSRRLAASSRITPADVRNWTPVQAAEESCRIVALPDFYPQQRVDAAYVQRFTPVMEARLQLAAARLAELLNRLLSGMSLP